MWKYFLCDSSYFFIKSGLIYMSKKQMYWYKRVQVITSVNFFPSSNFTPLHKRFILIWTYSKLFGKFQSKIWMLSCGNEFEQKWATFLFTIKTYKFVLHLLKEDGLNRWVLSNLVIQKKYLRGLVPRDFSWVENYKLI